MHIVEISIYIYCFPFFIPRHMIVAGCYGMTLAVRESICRTSVRPYFRFHSITWVNVYRFSPNLVRALILWKSGLGFLIGRFHQFLTELSAHNRSIFSFLDDNFSKYAWIFTKLGVCIDIVEICFGIADRQISSLFDRVICPGHVMEIWFGIVNRQISSIFDRVICPRQIHIFISGW